MNKKRHKMTPLERFMVDQQQIVAEILGVKFICFDEFMEQIGYSEVNTRSVLTHGRVPGAQIVRFRDGPRWIIPANHNFKINTKCQPKMAISKVAFERFLNEKGCPEDFFIDVKTGLGIAKIKPKRYGTWMRRVKRDEFNKEYDEFKKNNTAIPPIERIKPKKRVVSPNFINSRRPSNEELFPL